MSVKVFGEPGEGETQQVISLLEDAKIEFEMIDPSTSLYGKRVMFSVTGTTRTPVLCVDGVAYRGLVDVRRYFAR